MISLVRGGGGLPSKTLALALGIWVYSGSSALALGGGQMDGGLYGTPLAVSGIPAARYGVGFCGPGLWGAYGVGDGALRAWINEELLAFRTHGHGGLGYGTLGYGGYGLYPGFHGFGLSYRRGYGYGGCGLGVGAGGGYPYYGGPGYPCHGSPYDGGPAYSGQANALIRPDYPYGGPSSPAEANAGMGSSYRAQSNSLMGPGYPYYGYNSGEGSGSGYHGGFGPFTGASLYPYTHPSSTAEAAATGSVYDPFSGAGESEWHPSRGGGATGPTVVPPSGTGPSSPGTTTPNTAPDGGFGGSSPSTSPAPGGMIPLPAPGRSLGVDEEPAVDADGVRGLKVSRVYPGTATDRAGLQAGDVIHSINGYLTEQPGNLAWIIAKAAPNHILTMRVRKVSDGKEHTITAQLPLEPANTARPPYLPPVGNGPPPATR